MSCSCVDGCAETRALDLCHSAIDGQVDAGDVAAVVGSEEQRGFGDFLTAAHAPQRHLAGDCLLESIDLFLTHSRLAEDRRIDGPGDYGIDAEPAFFEVGVATSRQRA